jgi:hypothetical protein
MQLPNYLFFTFITSLSLFVSSCSKEQGPKGAEGKKSLMLLTPIGPNNSCLNGGTLVQNGIDKNDNNILDSTEIEDSAYVCNGVNGNYDKQIIIRVLDAPVSLAPRSELIVSAIPGFNKSNFVGVDSIVLFAQPYSGDQPVSFSKVELYNITDNQIIENSAVSSSTLYSYNYFLSSENCYASIPEKTIDLGIRLTGTYGANSGSVILMLYRK